MAPSPDIIQSIIEVIQNIPENLRRIPEHLGEALGLDFSDPTGVIEWTVYIIINFISGVWMIINHIVPVAAIIDIITSVAEYIVQAIPDQWTSIQAASNAFVLLIVSSGVGFIMLRAMEDIPVLTSKFGVQETMTVVFFMFLGSLPITLLRPGSQRQKFLSTVLFGAGAFVVLVAQIYSAMGIAVGVVLLLTLGVVRDPNSNHRYIVESVIPLVLTVLVYLFLASYPIRAVMREGNMMYVFYLVLLSIVVLIFSAYLFPHDQVGGIGV